MARMKISAARWKRALAIAVELGAATAARETGIAPATIRQRMSREGLSRAKAEQTAAAVAANRLAWELRRAELTDEIGAVAALALDKVRENLNDGKTATAHATTMAILVDKAQLLSGGATSRYGSETERRQVRDEARERALQLVPAEAA